MSECPYCQNTFEMTETCADEFVMWQGLVGPYYYPVIGADGYLTWTNTGDLPNPDPVNIIGPPGHGVDIKGIVATYADLPPSPDNGDVYLVGTEAPYDAYVYFEGTWTDIGDVSKGADGRGIVSITKTATSGNVDTYTITYTEGPLTSTFTVTNGVGVPSGGTTGQVLAKASGTDYDTAWIDPVSRPNLLDNWYFAGGGSQQGGGQFPINQRGQTSYSGLGYTIDRWKINKTAGSVSLNSDYLQIDYAANNQYANFEISLPESVTKCINGKQVTLSFLLNNTTTENLVLGCSATGGLAQNSVPSTNNLLCTTTRSMPSGISGSTRFFIQNLSTNAVTAKVIAVKLELGSTQTLAHQENGIWVLNEIPDYSEQLYRCCASTVDPNDTYANNPYFVPSVELIPLDSSLVSSSAVSIARYGKLRILNLAAEMINSGTWQTVCTLASKDRPAEQITSIAGGYGKQMSEMYVQADGRIQINAIESGWLKSTAIWIAK